VLSNIEPPALRRKAATDKLVEKIVKHDSWPIQLDILSPPLLRLTSRKLLWLDLQPVDIKSRWRHNWKSAQVVNSHNPTTGNQVSTSLGNSGLCWTVFARNRDTADICPFWTQKLPCFRPHSVEQFAWQSEERGHLTGTVQAVVKNCLVWARILVGGACEKSDFNRHRINVPFDLIWFDCGACRRKWQLSDTDLCPCGETQTMSHIVESCPLTKLSGGLSRLHSEDEDAVSWLTNYGKWHAYEKKNTEQLQSPCEKITSLFSRSLISVWI